MRVINKKARFNYNLLDRFEAGIVLTGNDVKAAKRGRIDLSNSYAKVLDNQLFLINANLTPENQSAADATRARKLLVHKNEIVSLQTKIKAKKLTLVPVKMYTKGRLVKVEIALAKPKKTFEKRALLKKKDIERDIARELRGPKEV